MLRPCHAAVSLALLAACGGGQPAAPSAGAGSPAPAFATYESAHFACRHTPMDAATIAATAAAVESHHARITGDLGIPDMPRVTVTLYADLASLRTGVAPLVGAIPSFASGLVTGPDAVHVLSPSLATSWTYEAGVTTIVHEFAHCVSLRLNPTIANHPRWLWETVALHEAHQVVDPRTLSYMTSLQPPTLAQLNRIEDTRIYEVGGLLGEFVAATWGPQSLADLVRANGDVQAVLAVDESTFTARWLAYTRDRYGF
jgi:hypothetical protein